MKAQNAYISKSVRTFVETYRDERIRPSRDSSDVVQMLAQRSVKTSVF